ncbi:hypothetical protein KGO04_01545 [Patescibacteria group bacterium]|nr:hypothetical protein [Patescibacteria group bacterium]MDE1945258.1 hypothetical protein [Patescibacteria group bacterium]
MEDHDFRTLRALICGRDDPVSTAVRVYVDTYWYSLERGAENAYKDVFLPWWDAEATSHGGWWSPAALAVSAIAGSGAGYPHAAVMTAAWFPEYFAREATELVVSYILGEKDVRDRLNPDSPYNKRRLGRSPMDG